MSGFLYRRERELYAPTEWAVSPWSRKLQHGGPVFGLVARAAEAAAAESGLRVARLHVDLFRPTPFEPLALAWRFVRQGRRLALVEMSLRAGDTEVTRGSALLLATSDFTSPWQKTEPPPPGPDGIERFHFMPPEYLEKAPPGFHRSVELRLAVDELGPALWVTTSLDLLEGEPISALVRAAMLSDLTFGLSGRLIMHRQPFPEQLPRMALINADVTLYLDRPPEGQWIALRHGWISANDGIGVAEVVQLDQGGRYGRSMQALVANPLGFPERPKS
jgi:hypothetical protein